MPRASCLRRPPFIPHEPRNDWQGSLATLARMAVQHGVELISIGNGTASPRESDKLAAEVIKLIASKLPERKLNKIVVSEAGRVGLFGVGIRPLENFPELDVRPARRRVHCPALARPARPSW